MKVAWGRGRSGAPGRAGVLSVWRARARSCSRAAPRARLGLPARRAGPGCTPDFSHPGPAGAARAPGRGLRGTPAARRRRQGRRTCPGPRPSRQPGCSAVRRAGGTPPRARRRGSGAPPAAPARRRRRRAVPAAGPRPLSSAPRPAL